MIRLFVILSLVILQSLAAQAQTSRTVIAELGTAYW